MKPEDIFNLERQVMDINFRKASPKQQNKLLDYIRSKNKRPESDLFKQPEEIVPKINPLKKFEETLLYKKNKQELDFQKQKYLEKLRKPRTA